MNRPAVGASGGRVFAPLPDRIPDILACTDLAALVEEIAGPPARSVGGTPWWHCPSPVHGDADPSFSIRATRWRCWSACGAGGDAIDFVQFAGVASTPEEAVNFLANRLDLPSPSSRHARSGTVVRPKDRGVTLAPDQAERLLHRYLKGRALPARVAQVLGLHVVLDRRGYPRVRHPFRLRGKTVYYADRAVQAGIEPRWLYKQGVIPCPYEADRLARSRITEVLACEGVSDTVAAVAAFDDPVVVGIPGGGGFKATWARAFEGLAVFLCPDNDPGGERFVADVTRKLNGTAASVSRLRVPAAYIDLSEWLVAVGDIESFGLQLGAAVALAEEVAG